MEAIRHEEPSDHRVIMTPRLAITRYKLQRGPDEEYTHLDYVVTLPFIP